MKEETEKRERERVKEGRRNKKKGREGEGRSKRSPNAPKSEDRSREETEWQELGAREAAWKLAKNVFKLKEHEKSSILLVSGKEVPPCINVET